MIKVGLVGCGSMGRKHIENLIHFSSHLAKLVAVCDIDITRCLQIKDTLHLDVAIYQNYVDMINSMTLDAIIIATPHYLHPTMAIHAIEANIHTMVEKPIGVYTKAVRELNEVAMKHPDVVFSVMYNQRTNPLYKKVKELVEDNVIGKIKRTNWIITNWYRTDAYYKSSSWRATWNKEGGGVLLNQDPHQLDLWQWICGLPTKVHTKMKFGSNRHIKVEDDVTAYVEYANGATGVFVTSVHEFPGTNRLEISGSKGQIIVENGTLILRKLSVDEEVFNKENTLMFGKPSFQTHPVDVSENAWGIQHAELLNNFFEAINQNATLIAPGLEAIHGLHLSNAMHLSAFLDKEVTLPIDDDLYLSELEKRIKEEAE